jgi:hypothetical protein
MLKVPYKKLDHLEKIAKNRVYLNTEYSGRNWDEVPMMVDAYLILDLVSDMKRLRILPNVHRRAEDPDQPGDCPKLKANFRRRQYGDWTSSED